MGLDAPQDALLDQDAEGVVHGLARDGADLGPDQLGHAVGGDVRVFGHHAQDGQALGGHLEAVFVEESDRVGVHANSI